MSRFLVLQKSVLACVILVLILASISSADITWTGNLSPANPTLWTADTRAYIGQTGDATLTVNDESDLVSDVAYIAYGTGTEATVTIEGLNSTWNNEVSVYIGREGDGVLNIRDGAVFTNSSTAYMGSQLNGSAVVTVDGLGSMWVNGGNIYVAQKSDAILNISNGGFVSTRWSLVINGDGAAYGCVRMSTGGKLAIWGQANNSIDDFCDLVDGTDLICYWDKVNLCWSNIKLATLNDDYTLTYITSGFFEGYTLLTVDASNYPPGDANCDYVVDVADLGILAANYGTTEMATWGMGDFNGDCVVDVSDLGLLAGNYGLVHSFSSNPDSSEQVTQENANNSVSGELSICSTLGLPLILCLMLTGCALVKLEN